VIMLQLVFLIAFVQLGPTWNFRLSDALGKSHTAFEWKDKKAAVLLFLATDCPISNRYAPVINRIAQEYSQKNITFFVVQSDPSLTNAAAIRHAREFGLAMPMLMDPKQQLAAKLDVRVTPTAIVLNNTGEVRYRGRIDDRNVDLGIYRAAPRREDLKLALEAVIAGKPVSEPNTKPIGCFLPPPGKE
jgi:thiol-disulfide isomerase/thioredoxin